MGEHIVEINLSPKCIIEREPRLLVDTSLFSYGTNLAFEIYRTENYKDMNFNKLFKTKVRLEENIDLLSLPKIYVIKETVDELKTFMEIISEKAKNLNNFEKTISLKTKHKRHFNGYEDFEKKKSLFNEICFLNYQLVKRAKERIYKPENSERYAYLVDAIKLLTEKSKLKKDSKIRDSRKGWEIKAYRRDYEDLQADEKFVAALFNSAFEQPLAGMSKDGDIRRIFNICYGLLASEDLLPYNQCFIGAMQKNPITLYAYSFALTRWEAIRTDKLWTEPFVIRKVDEKENIETGARVIGIFKKISSLEEGLTK
ncbi:MAG: hypothetical protein N3G19_02460 [Candidatus Pacearchaeota archaeon]|nr:hypothetical protein [Candidatus Pacearchaeota archaeon]